MESDMALSRSISASLHGTLARDRIDFIDKISQAILKNKLAEKKSLVSFFSRADKIFSLASNSTKTFFQVGGNFVFVILVLSFDTFYGATYVGALSKNDKKILGNFENMFSEYQYEFKFNNSEDCSCLLDSVYCIFDASRLLGSIEAYIESCEVYLTKELTENFKTFSIIRYIFLDKKLFLMSVISLNEIPNFFYLQEISGMEVRSITLSEHLLETFPRTNAEISHAETIIDELHINFLNNNKFGIIHRFCNLFDLMINLSIQKDDDTQLRGFSMIICEGFFDWCVYLILFRTKFSSLPLTLLFECICSPVFTPLQCFIENIHKLNEKDVSDLKEAIIKSLNSVAKNNSSELKCILNFLDSNNEDLNEEMSVIRELIPNTVLVHRYKHDFAGKTLLGGLISISDDLFHHEDIQISNAALILSIRHEICHKKWQFKGSNHTFSCKTPPYGLENLKEAGVILDRVALGHFDHKKFFNLDGINKKIAEKICTGIKLDSSELESIYVIDTSEAGSKNMGYQSNKHHKYLCTGRPSIEI